MPKDELNVCVNKLKHVILLCLLSRIWMCCLASCPHIYLWAIVTFVKYYCCLCIFCLLIYLTSKYECACVSELYLTFDVYSTVWHWGGVLCAVVNVYITGMSCWETRARVLYGKISYMKHTVQCNGLVF